MTDLQIAKNNLGNHTICLCKEGKCIFSEKRGIAPLMNFIADGIDLTGYSAADKVVGKAAAMLFVRSGVKNVFAKTLSRSGKEIFELHGVAFEYETLAEKIINRSGTDICPMERAVLNVDDIEQAYHILKDKLEMLKN